jgi:hypothetical protein
MGKQLTKRTERARTAQWQKKFLSVLSKIPSVKHACKSSGISRVTAYAHRKHNAEFAAAWLDAIAASVDELEAEAFKLALAGDSSLIAFMLRCHKPAIYRDIQRHEVGLVGGIVFLPEKREGKE